jgi:hypothetical protein
LEVTMRSKTPTTRRGALRLGGALALSEVFTGGSLSRATALSERPVHGLPPLKITDVRVIVTCPDRNYVLVKIMTSEPGLYGVGDATLNGRELAVAADLEKHIVPLLLGRDPEQIETRGNTFIGDPTGVAARCR